MSINENHNAGDGEFDRDLTAASRAYKNATPELPTSAMDDAIRAAARRVVKSQPRAIGKSWISRWSSPLSAAALVVLAVSVGFFAIDEQPELVTSLAPASPKEMMSPKTVPSPAAPETPLSATDSRAPAPEAFPAPALSQPATRTEKAARRDQQVATERDRLAESAKPVPDRNRAEAAGAAAGAIATKEIGAPVAPNNQVAIAPHAPAPVPVPAPSPTPAQATPLASLSKQTRNFVAEAPAGAARPAADAAVASPAKREESAVSAEIRAAAQATTAEAMREAKKSTLQSTQLSQQAVRAPSVAGTIAVAPTVYAPPAAPVYAAPAPPQTFAAKAEETPEAWMKRILELKQQGKTREFEEELVKFRKRYPDFALPEELKEHK